MNAGIIASRYAKAFLKYVQEEGRGKEIYSQVCVLVYRMDELPQMADYIMAASDVRFESKVSLLETALGQPVDSSVVRLLELVTERRRVEYFPRILQSFIEQYRKMYNIKVGSLVTAFPYDGLRDRLEGFFRDKMGAQVILEEKVDTDIIGGFIFELDGYRVDASVEGHLSRIRRALVEKNNRIV